MKRPDKTFWSLLLLSLAVLPLSAQHKKPQYLQYEDMRPYHFGFFVGLHTQDFQIAHTGAVDENGATWTLDGALRDAKGAGFVVDHNGQGKNKNYIGMVIALVVAGTMLVAAICMAIATTKRKSRKRRKRQERW